MTAPIKRETGNMMMKTTLTALLALAILLTPLCGRATEKETGLSGVSLTFTDDDRFAVSRALARELLGTFETEPPFDFLYGGKRFSDSVGDWRREITRGDGTLYVEYTKNKTTVSARYEVFNDTGAIEWSIRIRNDGTADSPVISRFNTLDISFPTKGNTKLMSAKGGNALADDFMPSTVRLKNGDTETLACNGGRSSSGVLPYFNLHTAKDKGYIVGIGWSGQWEAACDKQDGQVRVTAGMTDSNFYLMPGEDVMQPSTLLIPWEGEPQDAQNELRRHMLMHHTPRQADGSLPLGPVSFGAWGGSDAQTHLDNIKAVTNKKMGYDVYWIDAGWSGSESEISLNTFDDVWYRNAGNWRVVPSLYPQGMRQVADAARNAGMGMLLWFEPERAYAGTDMVRQHAKWLLSSNQNANNFIFNLGNPEARAWLTAYVSSLIQEYGVNVYRQDFNIEPLAYWRQKDASTRRGVTEMKYIEGLYLYWDGLLAACPGLLIDNCASGGRRLDFMALSRSVSLFRSDYACYADTSTGEGNQMEVYGLNYWLPITGTTSMGKTDAYNFRSTYGFAMQTPNTISQYRAQRTLIEEFRRARLYFYGDYYPLVACTGEIDDWFAYQMHRTDLDEGFVCAFRRLRAEDDRQTLFLSGLTPDAAYRLTLSDPEEEKEGGETLTMTGRELMEDGFTVVIDRTKSSALYFYEPINP